MKKAQKQDIIQNEIYLEFYTHSYIPHSGLYRGFFSGRGQFTILRVQPLGGVWEKIYTIGRVLNA